MSAPDPHTPASFQILADPSGRRRRRLGVAGRLATGALGLWLVVLILGGLGLHPLGNLPVFGGHAAPPALPDRVASAVDGGAQLAATPQPGSRRSAAPAAFSVVPAPRSSRTSTGPSRPARRRPHRAPASAKPTGGTGTPTQNAAQHPGASTTGGTPPAGAQAAPGQTKTPPAGAQAAPGQTKTPPAPAQSAPGQTKTPPAPAQAAPGQTKTQPGPATGNAHANGNAKAGGAVTTP